MKNRLGIIASGGGMSCSYSVGVSLALADLGITNPELIICSSGSVGTFAYWVAHQYDSILNIWENLATVQEFISYRRLNKIMDIDYMIDVVFKELDPLLVSKVRDSATDLFVGVTDYDLGEVQYFSNHDNVDFLEVLRASMAMPVAYNRRVTINNRSYVDGDISLSTEAKIKKAKSLGVNRLIVIENNTGAIINKLALYAYSSFINKSLRRALLGNISYKPTMVSPDILVVTPSRSLPAGVLNKNKQAIKDTIEIGYNDAIQLKYEALLESS